MFINALISFVIVAVVTFSVILAMNRARREQEVAPVEMAKEYPYCLSTIPVQATRCAYCPSDLG